ncbi:MAG: helix-turn-helix transcriptional regulator, partial [Leptospiraceae bacterium]|nr:helix-turn-helix transcriptional regulator [Leptospiraceae bacterium]
GDSDEAALLEALQAALRERQVYTQEGLTVGALARQLNVRDYRLRRLINQQLGFRNFNQFLNRYRIAEACRRLRLKDNEDYPIVRLAFDLGYQSLAPFNLAFKQLCGMTPTEYRRKQKSISSENAD